MDEKRQATILRCALLCCILLTLALVLSSYWLRPVVPPPVAVQQNPQQQEQDLREALEDMLININTADAQTLTQLPGIGEVLAQRICEYRQEHGSFATLDDLAKVKGIGQTTVDRLRPYAFAG